MIFDTSFLVELIRENPDAFHKAEQVHEDGEVGIITPIVIYELFVGAFNSQNPEQVRKVSNLIHMYETVCMDLESAQEGARILTDADSREHRDAMIAGIAESLNQTVLAGDSDFDDLGVDPITFDQS